MSFSKHILLVESDDESKEWVYLYLTNEGYQVTATATLAESLTLASARQFKLYLLGEGFEDGTNLDLCQQIRTFDSDTPILFCSAWAYPADIDRGMRAGAQAYLTKPCDPVELTQTIEQLIVAAEAQAVVKSARLRERANEGASNARRGALSIEISSSPA